MNKAFSKSEKSIHLANTTNDIHSIVFQDTARLHKGLGSHLYDQLPVHQRFVCPRLGPHIEPLRTRASYLPFHKSLTYFGFS